MCRGLVRDNVLVPVEAASADLAVLPYVLADVLSVVLCVALALLAFTPELSIKGTHLVQARARSCVGPTSQNRSAASLL